jgi:Domain of unknown function (DUF4269)
VHPDWYERLQEDGLLDVLAPYQPVVVGVYPLGIAADDAPVEIVCRSTDLPAFARVVERVYGGRPGFGLYPGALDGEEAVFAEFEAGGVPVEVSAQAEHVHRRLGAATMGVARVLAERGPVDRQRLATQVASGDDWLDAAQRQFDLSRTAVESLAGAAPAVVRRVSGVREPLPALRSYVLPIAVGCAADVLIALVGAARHSGGLTGTMLVIEALVLGAIFGVRMGLVAALVPLALFALLVGGSMLVGSERHDDLGTQLVDFLFVAVLVGGAAFIAGAIRDRYFARA